jgi:hypothetical protein
MSLCTETFEKASLRAGFFYELFLNAFKSITHKAEP